MSEVLYTNVFFFITGIAVIILSAIFCILLYQVIRTVKSIRRILASIERGTEAVSEDMQNIRSYFKSGGLIGGLMSILRGYTGQTSVKKTSQKKSKSKNKELKITDVTR